MTTLQRNTLARLPLSQDKVEAIYDSGPHDVAMQCIWELCESHERLRAELQGAMAMIAEEEGAVEKVSKALALTDTGSDAFRAAFPPASYEGQVPSGWRVVEKIREILQG